MAGPTSEFSSPVDIANSALQKLGVPRIDAFTDDAKGADETAFVYDKVRRAELQRNVWRFSTRIVALRAIDASVMQLVPAAWNIDDTYLVGSIVSYNGQTWQAFEAVPAAQQPDISPAYWDIYFGSMNVVPWAYLIDAFGPGQWSSTVTYNASDLAVGSDGNVYQALVDNLLNVNPVGDSGVHWLNEGLATVTDGYYAGELVYVLTGTSVAVYLSLVNGNSTYPATVAAWNASTTYNKNDVVVEASTRYQSLIDLNLGNMPPGAAWETIPVDQPQTMAGPGWLQLDSTVQSIKIVYPIGSGPGTQSTTKNAFQLPNGYLKEAPQDPKGGGISFLGAPGNSAQNDWQFQGNYIMSADTNVILLRFAADVTAVPTMTSMFCEGLACRIAVECCETLTQSTGKLQVLANEYKSFMGEARQSNAIENSSDEPPLDDWIACRI